MPEPLNPPPFTPPAWLANPHAQTLWPALVRRPPRVRQAAERLALPDGDVLNLVWGPDPAGGPLVLILHGLAGSARSTYVLALKAALAQAGMGSVVMEARGAGGRPNRLPRFFHAGETGDLQQAVDYIRRRHPDRPLALVGFSMGGIVALNWLGRTGAEAGVATAVVVSAPLRLAECARRLDQGFARLYQWAMVRDLKAMLRRKRAAGCAPPQIEAALRVRSLWAFDDRLTAPLHGFAGAADYYRRCAPEQRLDGIRVPTLMINAADDPFCPAATLPPPGALSPWVRLALSPGGGHLGFVHGRPWRPRYWLEPTLVERLRAGFSRPRAGAG
ncbi:hydrolase [Alkalilimnicola ehrlichii MLHE-1]|uniref:Alpha/beta hydrolase fold protein n=1 Tax=Alkalilimnicola ehrlichii (strain ATCC BAA-1101 / DSM 17681 / MLHE-1) TaxID=187272 RepID=Q0A5N7_ALKEH|nr:hydrolase [Alkalilimnicola ehrlichii]ABI57850.1 alpha/beta hydrolase fold protein [Alkalilimnicola ehrlichii MLHE-1]